MSGYDVVDFAEGYMYQDVFAEIFFVNLSGDSEVRF